MQLKLASTRIVFFSIDTKYGQESMLLTIAMFYLNYIPGQIALVPNLKRIILDILRCG